MKIIVTAYRNNAYLIPNFKLLAGKFLTLPYDVDISPEHEKLSSQLLRITREVDDEYIILLKEDFYIVDVVDTVLLHKCYDYAVKNKADRFSLQCYKDGYENSVDEHGEIEGDKIYKIRQTEPYLCSLEASIWRTDFLKKHLFVDGSDRDVELNMSKNVRSHATVFVPQNRIIKYHDALRGGKERIKVIRDSFHLMVQGPTGEDVWKNLNISAE